MSLRWEPWDWGRKRHGRYDEKRAKERQAQVGDWRYGTSRSSGGEKCVSTVPENTRRQLALSDASEQAARQKLNEIQQQVNREAALEQGFILEKLYPSDLASAQDSQQQQALTAFWKARSQNLKKAIGERMMRISELEF